METNKQIRVEIRESMKSLGMGRVIQSIFTWLTSVPYEQEKQSASKKSTVVYVIRQYLKLMLGFGLLISSIASGYHILIFFSVILSAILTVSAGRILQVFVNHHSVHNNFIKKGAWMPYKLANRLLFEFNSILLVIQDYLSYLINHKGHHNLYDTGTIKDPDMKFVSGLGFKPGKDRKGLYRTLWNTMLSPLFHARFFAARFMSNVTAGSWLRKILFFVYIIIWLVGLIFLPYYISISMALMLTNMTIFYQTAALLNFITEHSWWHEVTTEGELPESFDKPKVLSRYKQITFGRFIGDSPPTESFISAPLKWIIWTFRLIFIHVPIRSMVLVADMPIHDIHHLKVNGDILNALHERDNWANQKGGLIDVWGFKNQYDFVFDTIIRFDNKYWPNESGYDANDLLSM